MEPNRTLRFYTPFLALSLLVVSLAAASCTPAPPEPRVEARAERVFSGTSFQADTAEGATAVVLAGVTGPDRERFPDAAEAARRALLARLETAGAAVTLTPAADPPRDRYDRLIAAATTPDGDLAEQLVREGRLIAWPRAGQHAAFDRLYAAEAAARAENAGGWGAGVFMVRPPDPNSLAQHLDGPVIVEGVVVDTGEARDGRAFVNFGLDWRTDFTATADREARRVFEEAGIDLMALEGARVRVRGWLYETNGPSISLRRPAQLEIVDAPEPRSFP